jgi:hypothetical protein
MKPFAILSLAFIATAAAAAGYYDHPYSIIASEQSPHADPNLRAVIVNRVDGENAVVGGSYDRLGYAVVAPGPHKVTMDLPARKGFHTATQMDLDVETRPCVRYIVAAQLKTVTTQDWTPIVRREEPIGECERKFNVKSGVK